MKRERAEAVEALVAGRSDVSLHFHDQCFAEDGHFAGGDAVRL
ncbi:MAG TPA: LD-carboxypeptidase, partial [Erythrobacter sp.]|nr:LD-carboxypeptidase [Erythrobacter sp.]